MDHNERMRLIGVGPLRGVGGRRLHTSESPSAITRPRTSRRLRALAGIAGAVVALGATAGCGGKSESSLPKPSSRFCEAATTYDGLISGTVKPKKGQPEIDQQIALVHTMADHAPSDIKAATTTFLHAMEAVKAGDAAVKDTKAVRSAVDAVNRRAGNGCGLYQDQSGMGM